MLGGLYSCCMSKATHWYSEWVWGWLVGMEGKRVLMGTECGVEGKRVLMGTEWLAMHGGQ